MRYLSILLIFLSLLMVGCVGNNPLLPWLDADGYYTGYVNIDYPGQGFDHSFSATLRIWDHSYQARLTDKYGGSWVADYVDYDCLNDRLEIFFRVMETRHSWKCGYEVYDWEMRMSGRLYSGKDFTGDLQSDIDPEDYYSDNCYLEYNPPPKRIGTFNFHLDYGPSY